MPCVQYSISVVFGSIFISKVCCLIWSCFVPNRNAHARPDNLPLPLWYGSIVTSHKHADTPSSAVFNLIQHGLICSNVNNFATLRFCKTVLNWKFKTIPIIIKLYIIGKAIKGKTIKYSELGGRGVVVDSKAQRECKPATFLHVCDENIIFMKLSQPKIVKYNYQPQAGNDVNWVGVYIGV